jgi:hypothetical protein
MKRKDDLDANGWEKRKPRARGTLKTCATVLTLSIQSLSPLSRSVILSRESNRGHAKLVTGQLKKVADSRLEASVNKTSPAGTVKILKIRNHPCDLIDPGIDGDGDGDSKDAWIQICE